MKSKEVKVNWHQLMWDVLHWGDPYRQPDVQKWWARYFWNPPQEDEKEAASPEEAEAAKAGE